MTFGSGEIDPSQSLGGGSPARASTAPLLNQVTFSRRELKRILDLYGRKVAAGEWRDYAIDFLKDRAVFSVFRRTSEVPLYRIEKDPRLGARQGAYSVISATGQILRRGHELDRVLRVIDKPRAGQLAHGPEKWAPVFGKGHAQLLRRRSSAIAEFALHQHAVEPAAVLEADILENADMAKPCAACRPIEAACLVESPITAIICRKPLCCAASISASSSARPTPRRCMCGAM